jgi:hypothetical protein
LPRIRDPRWPSGRWRSRSDQGPAIHAEAARVATAWDAERVGRAGRTGSGREHFRARRRGGPRGTRPCVSGMAGSWRDAGISSAGDAGEGEGASSARGAGWLIPGGLGGPFTHRSASSSWVGAVRLALSTLVPPRPLRCDSPAPVPAHLMPGSTLVGQSPRDERQRREITSQRDAVTARRVEKYGSCGYL